ncbi:MULTISPECIES: glutamate racemase [Acetobacter]|uniref:Glutamate racemase n=1 Tax=Acetobacter pasteurianus subsp. pasteurianus TaxID=481145 RepID=A0A1Y0XWQ8_ACEPA|nr:aspartate/glutamate racemase family protein [Acetobacter pasteurianus]AKR49085.1 glutamate racemase [Acetobacter pasteurianus]ARW46532.1 Glutamate racemase [Acetobacter pasteurianus subsp. pasteurianus]
MQIDGPALSGPRHILAFDSGIGGLGIVRAIQALAPDICIDYLADTAIFPYGEQDDDFLIERIVSLLSQAIRRLQPQVVVVACNTASTLALEALRAAWPDMPFVGCVPPIRWAARITQTKVIGLLATRATVRRPYLSRLHTLYAPECTLIAHAAPGLAGCAELTFRGQDVSDSTLLREIEGLFVHPDSNRLDVVGLGCTHYTFVLDRLRALSPPGLTWLDPAPAVAQHTCNLLAYLPQKTHAHPCAWFTALPDDQALFTHLKPYRFSAAALWEDVNEVEASYYSPVIASP